MSMISIYNVMLDNPHCTECALVPEQDSQAVSSKSHAMRVDQTNQIRRVIKKRMGSDLILDELWENHRTLTVPETVGKVGSLVVYLLFALAFAGGMVYYSFVQSTTSVNEVSILSVMDISGMMPNASMLEDGQSETKTVWTCKMINPYPLAQTSGEVISNGGVTPGMKEGATNVLKFGGHVGMFALKTSGHQ